MKPIWKAAIVAILLSSMLLVGCGDAYRPVAIPISQPGGDPDFPDFVVAVQQSASNLAGSITVINVSGDTNMGNKPMGVGPVQGAFDGISQIFTANPSDDTVTVTGVTAFTLTTVTLLAGSHPVFVTGRGVNMFAANSGANSDCGSGSVSVISATQLTVTKNICVGSDPVFLLQSADATRLFVLDKTDNNVTVINTQNNTVVTTIPVGTAPIWATLSPDNKFVYVLNQGSHSISTITVADNTALGTAVDTGGTLPNHMVLDSKFNRLYTVNKGSADVSVFDVSVPVPVSLHAPIPVGASPVAITVLADGSRVFVANSGSATLTEINASNFLASPTPLTASTASGATVTWVASSRDGKRVYASFVEPSNLTNGTAVFRTTDNQLATTINATPQNVTCVPSTTTSCPLQRPVYLFGSK
ncbi:MAG TPA: YncE family protein [Clostridia bacterium]|nr:YncE family protein [Clostridia bacterium]